VKVLQACSGEETHTVWTGAIKRLIHRYFEHRNKRRAFRRGSAENNIVAPYEGRRWCDATERELIGDINSHGSYL
jgi:predicted GIY-YIG superfamily endonuclease